MIARGVTVRSLPEDHTGPCAAPTCPYRARYELVAGAMVYQVCRRHHEALVDVYGGAVMPGVAPSG